jgi:hypothetical protein
MQDLYQVFDQGDAPASLNKQHFRAFAKQLATILGLGTIAAAYTIMIHAPAVFPIALGLVVFAMMTYTALRFGRLRRQIIWNIQISDRNLIGYDLRCRKVKVDWIKVDKIELAENGLNVVNTKQEKLHISEEFPEFRLMSTCILEMADFYEIPVYTNRTSFKSIPKLHRLFPSVELH